MQRISGLIDVGVCILLVSMFSTWIVANQIRLILLRSSDWSFGGAQVYCAATALFIAVGNNDATQQNYDNDETGSDRRRSHPHRGPPSPGPTTRSPSVPRRQVASEDRQ